MRDARAKIGREASAVTRCIAVLALSLAGTWACASSDGGKGAGSGDGETGPDQTGGDVSEETVAGGVSRFRRLTHAQWERTIQDLFGIEEPVGFSSSFRSDPTQSGYLFEGNGDALEVDQALWSSYQTAALSIAKRVVEDDEILARIVPAGFGEGATLHEARTFIEEFGLRVHRRPLTEEQVDSYLALYEEGDGAYDDVTGYRAGVRLVLEAMLQSPYFLYRVEESAGAPGEVVALDGFERAVRLSYFLWGTMPDDALLASAASGDLNDAEGVRAEAARLVADERAASVFLDFFERVLEVERYETIAPASAAFPDVGEGLAESAKSETELFLHHEMFEKAGSLRDLLLSTTTYVDDELAAIYGLEGMFDETFQEATLDPSQRRGVLTHVGFLASHATSRDPDPIHRGVFLARRINCMRVSAPPNNVPPLPPSDPEKSNRQLVAEHTENSPVCAKCHAEVINPFGFAFENYDAVGGYRTMDGTHQVDASSVVPLAQGDVAVSGAIDLAEAMAESPDVHECLSGHLISYALGRPTSDDDQHLVTELGQASFDRAVPFSDLMVEMSVALVSLYRAPEAE